MKKKILAIIICFILIIIVGYIGVTKYIDLKNEKRYNEIKEDIDKELERYLYIVAPKCKNSSMKITHKTLVYNGGMDKDKFLDVDGKSYCKAYVNAKCALEGKWEWDTYISCKDYEDEGYVDWDSEFEAKE